MKSCDLFVSYASEDSATAFDIVSQIEKNGKSCFIAPRDLRAGYDYASEIIRGISNSSAVLLVFSSKSNRSGYVLREVNSTVSRNKKIIPLRIENVTPSESMEFYLGPTHWTDAFPSVLPEHILSILSTLSSMEPQSNQEQKIVTFSDGIIICSLNEAVKVGLTYKDILTKEIELDYLNVPIGKYVMNEDINGSFSDWERATTEYEVDSSCLAMIGKEIVGYCDFYPVFDESYDDLISGKTIIRDSMISLFQLGGEFNAYIAMMVFAPEHTNQKNFVLMFIWLKQQISAFENNNLKFKKIGISVYSALLEKFVTKLGFAFKCYNPAKGKVYEIDVEDLKKALNCFN